MSEEEKKKDIQKTILWYEIKPIIKNLFCILLKFINLFNFLLIQTQNG